MKSFEREQPVADHLDALEVPPGLDFSCRADSVVIRRTAKLLCGLRHMASDVHLTILHDGQATFVSVDVASEFFSIIDAAGRNLGSGELERVAGRLRVKTPPAGVDERVMAAIESRLASLP